MKEEISLKLIFDIIRSKIIIVLSATLLVAVLAAVITKFYIKPKYTSSIKLCIRSDEAVFEQGSSIASDRNQILYVKDLIDTCLEAINTGDAYSEMNKKLSEIDPSYENLEVEASALDIAQAGTSNMIQVTATTDDPVLSYNVCLAFEEMASERIPNIGNIQIWLADSPLVATSPSSPNLVKNCVIGALVGFILSAAIVILIEMLDNTVKDGETVARQMDILLLAEIPDIYFAMDERYSYRTYGAKSGGSTSSGSSHNRTNTGGNKNGR